MSNIRTANKRHKRAETAKVTARKLAAGKPVEAPKPVKAAV
jgi:hypothetical protein